MVQRASDSFLELEMENLLIMTNEVLLKIKAKVMGDSL